MFKVLDQLVKQFDNLVATSRSNRKNLYSCAVHYADGNHKKMLAVSIVAGTESEAKIQAKLTLLRLKPTAIAGTIVVSCATTELIDIIKREC